MHPVSNWRKFDWTCTNRRQLDRVLWRLVPWWGRERNWTRVLAARASTTSFRGCSCHPSGSKLQSHRSRWGPSRTVQSRRKDRTGQNDRICVAIWETGEWPEEWTFSTFIPLPKKDDLKQCANYRTIALVSHASKILLIFGSYIDLIQSPQFGTKSQREVPQFSSYKNFLITKCGIGRTNRQTDTLRQRTPR